MKKKLLSQPRGRTEAMDLIIKKINQNENYTFERAAKLLDAALKRRNDNKKI